MWSKYFCLNTTINSQIMTHAVHLRRKCRSSWVWRKLNAATKITITFIALTAAKLACNGAGALTNESMLAAQYKSQSHRPGGKNLNCRQLPNICAQTKASAMNSAQKK